MAAGSVVVHDVKEGEVVAGNLARVIGSNLKLKQKRFSRDGDRDEPTYEEIWQELKKLGVDRDIIHVLLLRGDNLSEKK